MCCFLARCSNSQENNTTKTGKEKWKKQEKYGTVVDNCDHDHE